MSAWHPDLVVHEMAELAAPMVSTAWGIPYVDVGYGSLIPRALLEEAGVAAAAHWRARGLEPHPLAGAFRYLYVDPCPAALQNQEIADVAAVQPMRPAAAEVQDTERAGWLDDLPPRPTVYVTLGTVWNTDLDVFRLVIEALRDHVNLVVTVGRQNDPAVLGPQPRGVIIRSYIAQHELLPWCDAVVAHGGSGTVLGALAHGVPLLVIPQGADQWSNAEQIVTAGAGQRLLRAELSAVAVRDCVMELLSAPSYRQAASNIKEQIRAMPSATEAIVGLEALL
ncbi:MAG: glycosyltransferase [Acidimicrobiia bacterium]